MNLWCMDACEWQKVTRTCVPDLLVSTGWGTDSSKSAHGIMQTNAHNVGTDNHAYEHTQQAAVHCNAAPFKIVKIIYMRLRCRLQLT